MNTIPLLLHPADLLHLPASLLLHPADLLLHLPASLLLVHLDNIVLGRSDVDTTNQGDQTSLHLLHLEGLGGLVVVDPATVEQEAEAGNWNTHLRKIIVQPSMPSPITHPLAVALLELAHLGGLLHPEVDLVGVLANHLQFYVLGLISHVESFLRTWYLKQEDYTCINTSDSNTLPQRSTLYQFIERPKTMSLIQLSTGKGMDLNQTRRSRVRVSA